MDDTRPPVLEPGKLVTLSALAAFARDRTEAEFVATFPWPALVFDGTASPEPAPEPGASRPFNLMTLTGSDAPGTASHRFRGQVAFLRKRPGNPFASMISLGRASNTDVTLELDTISKMHGYFVTADGAWSYSDRSTNGSHVNGRKIGKDEKCPIQDRDLIRLGTDLEARFLLPRSLHARLRGAP